jgi:hypothetical protein
MLAALPMARFGAQIVAGLGVSKIVTDIIKNNVAIVTPIQKVTVSVGTFVLGSIAVEQSSNHIERATADLTKWLKNHKVEVIETSPTTE